MRRRSGIRISPWIAGIGGLIAALVLQTAFFPGLLPGVSGIEPVFGLAMALAVLGHMRQSLFVAVAGGLVLDSLTGQYMGLNALCLLAVVILALRIQRNLVKDTLVAPAAIMFGGYAAKELIYLFVLVSTGLKLLPMRVAAQLAFSSVMNALLGSTIYWLLHFKLGVPVKVD